MKSYNQIKETHQLYCNLTSIQLPWQLNQLYAWELFCSRFSDEDLKLVVRFIKDKQFRGRPARSFTFRNFISGPNSLDYFAEDLAEAKAHFRGTRVDPDRASVLRATHRPEYSEKPPASVVDIMKEHATMASLLKNFRETL